MAALQPAGNENRAPTQGRPYEAPLSLAGVGGGLGERGWGVRAYNKPASRARAIVWVRLRVPSLA